jgi:hypothetical protein
MYHKNLSASQAIAATGGGVDVDISAYQGRARFIFASLNTAGTLPTHDRKLQSSVPLAQSALNQLSAGATDNQIKTSSSVNTLVGVKFTQSGARQIKSVGLMIKKIGTIAAAQTLTMTIQTNSGGLPSGTAIGTSAALQIDTAVGTSYAWVTFTFANPVDVADSTIYHLVVTASYTASGSNCCVMRSLTAASGGTLMTKTDTTWSNTSTEKVEVYALQYAFADVTGGAQTQATAAVVVNESDELDTDAMGPIVRVYDTIGGTVSPSFVASCDFVCTKKVQSS